MRFIQYFSLTVAAVGMLGNCTSAQQGQKNNFYGTHLVIDNLDGRNKDQVLWTKRLVGKDGYIKTLFYGITPKTQGANQSWKDFVQFAYDNEMIPVIRLGGVHSAEKGYWLEPEQDADGSYTAIAQAVKLVVEGLPRSDKYPLYIEVWNEPNLAVEWTGKPDLPEYARFFVACSKAIRSIGDNRIKILNGAFALSPKATEECIKADPEFINAFDVWASHCYPQNTPPEFNIHDNTAISDDATIDGYRTELAVLEKYGRKNVKVMITEGGYSLGNAVYPQFPAIDEYNRSDYITRAFRDYYPNYPEVLAVFPFLFSDPGWLPHNWVHVDSGTDPATGYPTKPHYQYVTLDKMSVVTDPDGSISGKITDCQYHVALKDVSVHRAGGYSTTTDVMGNFYLPRMQPGKYTLTVKKKGFGNQLRSVEVKVGANAVANFCLASTVNGKIVGIVADGATSDLLDGAEVTLTPGDQKTVSNKTGFFSFNNLPAIPFQLTATKAGMTTHTLKNVVVQAGSDTGVSLMISENKARQMPNMAVNPSFENITDPESGTGYAVGWEDLRRGKFSVVPLNARTGHLSQLAEAVPDALVTHRQITHYSTVNPGDTFVAGLWMKTYDIVPEDDGGAWVSIQFTGQGGEPYGEVEAKKITGATDWVYYEVQGIAPEKSARFSLNMNIKAKSGKAYFDDAYIGILKKAGQ